MSRNAARALLLPLVPVYAAVVAAKNWLYDRGLLKVKRLPHPVISVGSYSAGGAGKTPVVMMFAEWFNREEFEVRILTRGYGRKGSATEKVDPDGDAAHFGDEPVMMARMRGNVSVWVGADRFRAGVLAAQQDTAESRVVYLLDDGYQHRKLARTVDVVLVTRQDVGGQLLPAGDLREPLGCRRGPTIWIVREDEPEMEAVVQGMLPGRGCVVWVARRMLVFHAGVVLPKRPVVFCALARPDGFIRMLGEAGIVPAAVTIFPDHHPYSDKDVDRLIKLARRQNADGFLTTHKDLVKLETAMRMRLDEVAPVLRVDLQVKLVDEERAKGDLFDLLYD